MSRELTCTGLLAYDDGVSDPVQLALANPFYVNVATKITARDQQSILTTETVINLGGVAVLGYWMMVNRDTTNYVDVKIAAASTIIARLDPNGGFCIWKIGSGITAPVAIANTAACIIDKLILSL